MSEEYTLRVDEHGDIYGCDCCSAEVPTSLFEKNNCENMFRKGGKPRDAWLCKVCASTHFSKALFYPSQCSDTTLYGSLAAVSNMILEQVGAFKNAPVVNDWKGKDEEDEV